MTSALLVVATCSGSVWADGGTQRWEATYRDGEPAFSQDVVTSPDGATVFVTGGTDTTLAKSHYATVAYDAASGDQRWSAEFPSKSEPESGLGRMLAVSPDGQKLFVTGTTACRAGCTGGAHDGYATVAYDAATGKRLWVGRHDAAGGGAHDISVSPEGSRLYVSGSSDGGLSSLVLAYDTATGSEAWRLKRSTGLAYRTAMTLSADGSTLFMADPAPGQPGCFSTGGGYRTTALNTADGSQIWSSTYTNDGSSCGLPTDLASSPDGRAIFVTGYDRSDPGNRGSETVALDATSGAVLWDTYDSQILTLDGDSKISLGVDPDGSKIVVFGNRCEKPAFGCGAPVGSTLAFDAASGVRLWSSSYTGGGQVFANALAVAPDGSSVYVTGQETMPCYNPCDSGAQTNAPIIAYDLDTGAERWAAVQTDNYAQALAVSPDGTSLFTAGASTRSTSSTRSTRTSEASRRARCSSTCGFSTSRANTGPGPGTRQDNDASVGFDGWRGHFDKNASAGAYRASRTRGDVAVFTTPVTSKVALLTQQGPDRGKAKVIVDGRSKGTIDLYAATASARALTFTGLKKTPHTIKVKVLGRKQAASSGKSVAIDGYTYAAGSGITQENAPEVTFNSWTGAVTGSAGDGSLRVSSSRAAKARLEFSGRRITLVTATGPAYGLARVVIDGKVKTVDLYSPRRQGKVKFVFKGLSRGEHRITVSPLGRGDRRSVGSAVVVDAFVVGG